MVAKNWPNVADPIVRAYATASRAAISMDRAATCNELRQRRYDIKAELRDVVARRTELGSDNVSKRKAQLQARLRQVEGELETAEAVADAANESCQYGPCVPFPSDY